MAARNTLPHYDEHAEALEQLKMVDGEGMVSRMFYGCIRSIACFRRCSVYALVLVPPLSVAMYPGSTPAA